jgi:spermidine/putrescine-binding protein
MKKKIILVCAMTVILISNLAGCGSNNTETGSTGYSGETLNVLTWEGDVADDVVASFEEEYGVNLNITYVEDTNTILAKMLQGNCEYDVIDIESAYVKSFVDAQLLTPLDYDKLTNYDNIESAYVEKGAIGDEELKYTLPICGPLFTGIVINKETCPIEIESFQDLADTALEGQLWCTNATISLYAEALLSLGYSPNSDSEEELNEAQELLSKIKKNVKAFGASSVSPLETGDCSVAFTYDYNILMCDDKANWDKFTIVPTDVLGYTQYWSVAANSEKQDLANEFINYTYSIDSAVALAQEWGGVPVVKQELVQDRLDDDYFDNPMMSEFAEMWENHEDLTVSDTQTAIMDQLYNELMSGDQ